MPYNAQLQKSSGADLHVTAGTRPNDKEKVRDHYDRMSPYYHSLWGEHIHHGYWIRGDESKEVAQVQLIEHLARAAGIPPGARILDVGCGFGASSGRQCQVPVHGRRSHDL